MSSNSRQVIRSSIKVIRSWWRDLHAGIPTGISSSNLSEEERQALIGEAEAVVEGRVAERLLSHGQKVPSWAWFNALAHRPPEEVLAIAPLGHDSWARAAFEIATTMYALPDDKAAHISDSLLVPLELNALAGRSVPGGASQVVKALERRLSA